jgi:mannose-6-phosphate isomerase-like protein (cupin superfamily)
MSTPKATWWASASEELRMAAPDSVVNLEEKLAIFDDRWAPRIIAQINDLHVKVVKVEGEFVWHDHADTDEFFLVLSGELTIEMRDRPAVTLNPGELFVVPRGVEHRPSAAEVCELVLLEPAGVVNTGEADSELTASTDEWI